MKCLIMVIIFFLILYVYRYLKNNRDGHSLNTYKSVSTDPIQPKEKYADEVDFVMYPLSQATRLENSPQPNKRDLYNVYNEAVARYNIVYPHIRKNPQVPNVETITTQRDRAYLELLTFHVNVDAPVEAIKTVPKEEKLKIEIKSSAQNVHDHNVNDELSKRYKTLKSLTSEDGTLESMLEFISKNDTTKQITINLALRDTISRFDNETEEDIWYTVWRRIHSKDNLENRNSLLLAFKQAIEDCVEDKHLVCTTGRVTRVLDSLTLLDANLEISKSIKTDDIARKDVYDSAHKILQRELNKRGALFKKQYEDDTVDNTEEFDKHVKECIERELEDSKYKNDAIAAI